MESLKGSFLIVPISAILTGIFTYFNSETEEDKYNTSRYITNILFVSLLVGIVVMINSDNTSKISINGSGGNGEVNKQVKRKLSMKPIETILTGSADF